MTTTLQQWNNAQANPEVPVNENFASLAHVGAYAMRPAATTGLTWAYYGGRWGGTSVADGTLTLAASATNHVVVNRSTGAISVATASTNWDNTAAYARVYKLTTGTATVTAVEDHRAGPGGVHGQAAAGSGNVQSIIIAVGDETTPATVGVGKVTFRMPYAFTLSGVRASLKTAQSSGSTFTVDINEGGVSILSTKLTIDNTEKTSTTAATAAVISDASLADDAEITIDIDQVGDGTAIGLKVALIGSPV